MAAASAADDIENMTTAILLLLLSAIWLPTPCVPRDFVDNANEVEVDFYGASADVLIPTVPAILKVEHPLPFHSSLMIF